MAGQRFRLLDSVQPVTSAYAGRPTRCPLLIPWNERQGGQNAALDAPQARIRAWTARWSTVRPARCYRRAVAGGDTLRPVPLIALDSAQVWARDFTASASLTRRKCGGSTAAHQHQSMGQQGPRFTLRLCVWRRVDVGICAARAMPAT